MWSKLSADLLGKEAQEALTGALQKGKDAWQSIEASLDQAVDPESVPIGNEEDLPISLPPPRVRTSSAGAATVAGAGNEADVKETVAVTDATLPAAPAVPAPSPPIQDEAPEPPQAEQEAPSSPPPTPLPSPSKKDKRRRKKSGAAASAAAAPNASSPSSPATQDKEPKKEEAAAHPPRSLSISQMEGSPEDVNMEASTSTSSSSGAGKDNHEVSPPAPVARPTPSPSADAAVVVVSPTVPVPCDTAAAEALKTQYERDLASVHEELRDSEERVQLLEKEIKKAQAIYLADEGKQRQIQALQEEGKALAFKQGEMEKLVRKSRGELKGVEAERDRLQEERDALEAKAAALTELVKKKETENSGLQQSLAAVQAVNKASADKTSKLEQELGKAQEELASQRAALDKAWGEEKEMKRLVSQMTATTTTEHGTAGQEDEGKAVSQGLAGIKQDFEQREAVLTATNKQLQEALTRANFEAGLCEDALRQELSDMRKRWQDAVSRTEGLAADMHESTAPLLRQIKALQEEARVKAGAWTSAEEALTERARTAEGLARGAEAGRLQLGEKVEALTSKVGELEVQLQATTSKLHETAAQLKTMEGLEGTARGQVSELESELKEAREAVTRVAKDHKAQESKLKGQLQEAKDALLVVKGDLEHEQARLQLENETLRKELGVAKERRGRQGEADAAPVVADSPHQHHQQVERLSQSSILERTISGSLGGSSHGGGRDVAEAGGGSGDGAVSVLALEKLHQALRQKEEEVTHLQKRLQDVERTRDALTDEVTMLSRKAALLQNAVQASKALRAQVADLAQKKDVLLELLGEKEEELESLQGELVDLKTHFRSQLDDLLSPGSQQVLQK